MIIMTENEHKKQNVKINTLNRHYNLELVYVIR